MSLWKWDLTQGSICQCTYHVLKTLVGNYVILKRRQWTEIYKICDHTSWLDTDKTLWKCKKSLRWFQIHTRWAKQLTLQYQEVKDHARNSTIPLANAKWREHKKWKDETDETLRAGKLTPSHICSKQESVTRKNKSILSNLDVNVPIFSLLQ